MLGAALAVGDEAPPFQLQWLPTPDDEPREIDLASSAGESASCTWCTPSTRRSASAACTASSSCGATLPDDVDVYTVSMDLPYAQARLNRAEGVQHRALSAHRGEDFGRDYGVLIREWRLLQRSVFVIDRDDRLVYVEYVGGPAAGAGLRGGRGRCQGGGGTLGFRGPGV